MPTGIALDMAGNIYVSDAGNPPGTGASIRVFAVGSTGDILPIHVISGSNTLLNIPTDVKLDSTGRIYVADSGANKIYIFAAGVFGNVAPAATLNVNGQVIGIGLAP
jgi:sugar lactone lactonase YvrE